MMATPSDRQKVEGSREIVERELKHASSKGQTEKDAEGQFKRSKQGSRNNGVSSANPRALSRDHDGDATFPVKHDK